jgi:hypothetical protein
MAHQTNTVPAGDGGGEKGQKTVDLWHPHPQVEQTLHRTLHRRNRVRPQRHLLVFRRKNRNDP